MRDPKPDTFPLPLVVQLGFAGSRRLLDGAAHPSVDAAGFDAAVEAWLVARLRQLRADLGLEGHHFFCGISAVAAGADTLFGRACLTGGILLRAFLPQARDAFLGADGSDGPDFTPAQRAEAARLLDSPHVIQERPVSDSNVRAERFADVNREIVRVSDVLVCLLRDGSVGRAGGSEDLVARAVLRRKPVLVVRVGVGDDGEPAFAEEWRLPDGPAAGPALRPGVFDPPVAPPTLAGIRVPAPAGGGPGSTGVAPYLTAVKGASSSTAKAGRARFRRMAVTIIGAHVGATLLAALALGLARFHLHALPALLGAELGLLATGLWVHGRLHRTHAAHRWAEARLLAEVARSVLPVGNLHVYLEYLFALPFPAAVRAVLRTVSVLHLRGTRHDREDWRAKRDRYVAERLALPGTGQVAFYGRQAVGAARWLRRAAACFYGFWTIAAGSTLAKLAFHDSLEEGAGFGDALVVILGTCAVVTPVLAAGALSFAAALDLRAQEHTYREMLAFLRRQAEILMGATSERDVARLVLETEAHLLGETANWFSRRSYTSVA